MKKSIIAAAIASATLAYIPANALEAAAPTHPPSALDSQIFRTFAAAAKELEPVLGETNVARKLDAYSKFQFSPELRPRLKEVFGSERPFAMTRLAGGPKGQLNYVTRLAPHTYHDAAGVDLSWSELQIKASTDKAGRSLISNGSWASLTMAGKSGAAELKNMRFTSRQTMGADTIQYGTTTMNMGAMVFSFAVPGTVELKEGARFEEVTSAVSMSRRGKNAEIGYAMSVGAMKFGSEHLEHGHFGVRLVNVPAEAVADVGNEMRRVQGSQLAMDARHQLLSRSLISFGKRIVKNGAALIIDDISAAYHGNTAAIKGRFEFAGMTDDDFSTPSTWRKKLLVHLDVHVPVALVNDVTHTLAVQKVDAAAPNALEQIDVMGKNIAGMVIGKMVNEGYAVIEKGELHSAIDIKDGKLTFNGKIIAMPGMVNGEINDIHFGPQPTRIPDPAPQPVQIQH